MSWAWIRSSLAPREPGSRSLWWHWIIAAAIGAILFYAVVIVFPRFSLLYGYSGVKRLLYEDLSLSEAWSSFFALIGSFIYAILWLPLLRLTLHVVLWKFDPLKTARAFVAWIVIYGHVPLLHALFGSEVCFNQRTGEPLKWYVIQPGGQIVLYDSPGFDAAGVQKRPATVQICRVLQLQKKGLRPREVSDDPRYVKFFDEVTGQPRIWYSKGKDGQIRLFDGEGTNPSDGQILNPITRDVIREVQEQAIAKQAEAERALQLKAEEDRREADRKESQAKEDARKRLVSLFDTASYSPGVVILGAISRTGNSTSALAASRVQNVLLGILGRKGIPVDEFRSRVYADGYFKTMFDGNAAVLAEVGLAQKMRAAILAKIDTSCRPATSDLTSCIVTVEVRILNASGNSFLRSISETGAGATAEQAVVRATELVAERHADVFDGI